MKTNSNNKTISESKKGVTPIIAISLLLVVAVAATLSFSGWYTDLTTGLTIKSKNTEQYSDLIDLKFVHKQDNNLVLYYENKNEDFIFINSLKINNNACNLVGSDILEENSLTYIEVSNCNQNITDQVEIILVSESGIFENSKQID